MNEILRSTTTRRTLLQRSLVFLAGALGVPLASEGAGSQPTASLPEATPGPGGTALRLYARRLKVHSPGHKPGQLPTSNGRLNSHGDLLDQPNGTKVGEYSATCFSPESAFGCVGSDHAVEFQTLKMIEGTLFGMGCAAPTVEGERAQAILGGTGRFSGAKGSYVIRPQPVGHGGESVELLITLTS